MTSAISGWAGRFPATNSSIGIVADGMGVDFTWALMFLGRLGIVPALIPGSEESNTYAYQTSRRGWLAAIRFPDTRSSKERIAHVADRSIRERCLRTQSRELGLLSVWRAAWKVPLQGRLWVLVTPRSASSQESAGSHRGAAVGMEACLGNAVANDRELEILSEDPL